MTPPQLTPTPAPMAPAKTHLGYLDGLRALAAIYVVLHHSYQQFDFAAASPLARLVVQPFAYGHYAVDIFIVLSGFCLMLPAARGDGSLRGGAFSFFAKRARRILPPYFFAMAVSLLLIVLFVGHKTGTHWDLSVPVTAKGFWLHALMLQDIFGNNEINHAFWSVSVEWRIYFLFPLLVLAFRRFGAVPTTVAALAISYAVWVALKVSPLKHIVNTLPSGCSPYYLGLFTMGMLAAKFAFASPNAGAEAKSPTVEKRSRRWALLTLAAAAAVCIVTVTTLRHGHTMPQQAVSAFTGAFGTALLVWLTLNSRSWACRLLSSRPLVFLGMYAYSIYLIHAPLVQMVWQYIVHPITRDPFAGWLLMALVGSPLILGVAYLFFLAFERPFLTSRRKETTAETERDAARSPAP